MDTKDEGTTKTVKEEVKVEKDDSSDDEGEAGPGQEEPKEKLLDDVEAPDYSSSAGTCTVDNKGVARQIDDDGVKTVYRNDCFGDKLVKYGCEGGELTTDLENCDKECIIVNYVARCA